MLRPVSKWLSRGLAASLAGLTVLLAMLFWRLATAGLSLSFVTPYVNASLDQAAPGYRIEVGGTELFWQGLDAPLGVLASDVRIAPLDGPVAATIPRLHLDFAIEPLLNGELRLTRAEAIGALLHLTRNAGGELGLAVIAEEEPAAGATGSGQAAGLPGRDADGGEGSGQEGGDMPPREGEEAVLSRLAAQLLEEVPDGSGTLAALRSVGVTRSRLVIDDAITGRSWQAEEVQLAAERGATGIEMRGAMVLDLGSGRTLPVAVSAFHRLRTNAADIRITGGPVYPAELALDGGAPWLQALDAPLLFETGFRFDGGSLPAAIEGRITGPIGRLRLPDLMRDPLPLSDLDLRFRLDPEAQRLEVSRLSLRLAGADFAGGGSLAWTGAPMAVLSGAGKDREPARLSALSWQGSLGPLQGLRLRNGRLELAAGTPPPAPTEAPGGAELALETPLSFTVDYRPAPAAGAAPDGRPAHLLRAELAAGAAFLTLPESFAYPLALGDVAVGLRYDGAASRLAIEHAALNVEDAAVSLNGHLLLAPPDGPGPGWRRLVLDGDLGSLDMKRLLRLWPPQLAPPVRDWFAQNLEQAQFQTPQVALDLDAEALAAGKLPEGSLDLQFGLADAVLSYLPPMAPIRNLSGTARLTQDAFRLSEAAGALEGVRLSAGSLALTALQDELPLMDIRFRAQGSIAAMMRVLDQKPLELPRRIEMPPAAVGGNAALDVNLAFPLRSDLDAEDVAFGAAGPLKGVELQDVIGDIDLSRGALQVSANRDRLEAKGEAWLAGVPAAVEWRQPFDRTGTARYRVRARLDELQRRRWGLEVAPFVTGPLAADFTFLEAGGGSWEMGASLDLGEARLAVPVLHIDKPPGMPASAALRGALSTGGFSSLAVDNLVAPGLGLTAELGFSDGAVSRIDLQRLQLGETALSGWAQANPNGIWSALLQGARADLRPYLDGLAESGRPGGAPDPGGEALSADLVLNVADAIVADDFSVADLAMELSLRDGRMERLQGQAGLPGGPDPAAGGGTVRLRVARDGGGLRFALNSDNAGKTFRTIGFDKLSGGTLVAVGTAPAAAPGQISARAVVQGGLIVDVPGLEEMISAPGPNAHGQTPPGGSPVGGGALIPPGAAPPNSGLRPVGGGVPVDVAEMDFELQGRTLLVHSLRARGPEVGLTMQGEIGLGVERVAMTGTFVPAYALNSVFGRIPIIGDLLIGREGEGLIGFTFRVSGPLERPDVVVNPLSGLAPGFLRRLFEFTPPDLSASN